MEKITKYLLALNVAEAKRKAQKPERTDVDKEEKEKRLKKIPVPKLDVFDDCTDVKPKDWLDTW